MLADMFLRASTLALNASVATLGPMWPDMDGGGLGGQAMALAGRLNAWLPIDQLAAVLEVLASVAMYMITWKMMQKILSVWGWGKAA